MSLPQPLILLRLHPREQPVGIGDGPDTDGRKRRRVDQRAADIDQKLAQPPAAQYDRAMTAYRFSESMDARETLPVQPQGLRQPFPSLSDHSRGMRFIQDQVRFIRPAQVQDRL